MKNISNLIFASVLLVIAAATGCQKISVEGEPEGWANKVRFTLSTPSPVTKAIGDGMKAKTVYYAAFVNGKVVPSLCNEIELDENGNAVINVDLVRYVDYRFVFWAQTPVDESKEQYYDMSTFFSDGKIKVNYEVKANDDLRDAFCAAQDIYVKGKKEVKVTLRRPFAQINFCASDYELLKQLDLQKGMMSQMKAVGIADTINLLDGSVSCSEGFSSEALFEAAPIPSGEDEYITVLNKQYGYCGMNYVLASEYGDMVSVKGSFINGETTWETVLLPNVPVRRNYKTNILGELFVEHGQLHIVIEPDFDSPDEVITIQ